MKVFLAFAVFCLIHGPTINAHTQANYQPPSGYVPDAKTAISIAVAVWSPIYGEKQIEGEKPYHAVLNHGIWTVMGSLPKPMIHGGVALVEIAKKDSRILRVIHGR